MDISRAEAHDVKNQLAIAAGMVEISIRYVKKDQIEVEKIADKLEKALAAIKRANLFFETKKETDQV